MDVLFLFEALDQSALANISKAYGGIFAVVQMFHLLAMALLGGMILVCDLRLLGLILTDISSERICKDTQKWFDAALCVMLISGIFMSSAVALKTLLQRHVLVENVRFGARRIFCLRPYGGLC